MAVTRAFSAVLKNIRKIRTTEMLIGEQERTARNKPILSSPTFYNRSMKLGDTKMHLKLLDGACYS
jgi:hypothetical protein